jgi:hypothetical protein
MVEGDYNFENCRTIEDCVTLTVAWATNREHLSEKNLDTQTPLVVRGLCKYIPVLFLQKHRAFTISMMHSLASANVLMR